MTESFVTTAECNLSVETNDHVESLLVKGVLHITAIHGISSTITTNPTDDIIDTVHTLLDIINAPFLPQIVPLTPPIVPLTSTITRARDINDHGVLHDTPIITVQMTLITTLTLTMALMNHIIITVIMIVTTALVPTPTRTPTLVDRA